MFNRLKEYSYYALSRDAYIGFRQILKFFVVLPIKLIPGLATFLDFNIVIAIKLKKKFFITILKTFRKLPTNFNTPTTSQFNTYTLSQFRWLKSNRYIQLISDDSFIAWGLTFDSKIKIAVSNKLKYSPKKISIKYIDILLLRYITILKIDGHFDRALEIIKDQLSKSTSSDLNYFLYLNKADIYNLFLRWSLQFTELKKHNSIQWYKHNYLSSNPSKVEYFRNERNDSLKLAEKLSHGDTLINIFKLSFANSEQNISASNRLREDIFTSSSRDKYTDYFCFKATNHKDPIYLETRNSLGLNNVKMKFNTLPIREVEVKDWEDLRRTGVAKLASKSPQKTLDINYRRISSNEVIVSDAKLKLECSSFASHEVKNLVNLGDGHALVDYDYLIKDSKHLDYLHTKQFSPNIINFSKENALITLDDLLIYESDKSTIILPGHCENYYHWIIDALGALSIIDGQMDYRNVELIIPFKPKKFHMDTLNKVLPEVSVVEQPTPYMNKILWRNALSVQFPNRFNLTHPYAVEYLRKKMGSNEQAQKGKRFYLGRFGQGSGRSTTNEKNIINFLKPLGFKAINTAAMTLDEQRSLMSNAEIVIAPAGAAQANLIFASPETKLINLATETMHFETFTSLSSSIGLETWVTQSSTHIYPNPYLLWTTFDFEVNTLMIKKCLDEAL